MSTIKKIVILGGESTGKSTLSEQLAAHYHTEWVPEYARTYLQELGRPYAESDLVEIAIGQLALEEMMAEMAKGYLFCDTDLHVLKIWSEHAYGRCHGWILDRIADRNYHAYVITAPDFPWEPDPLREHPEPHWREYFFKQYISEIAATNLPMCIVTGNKEERLQRAIAFVDRLI